MWHYAAAVFVVAAALQAPASAASAKTGPHIDCAKASCTEVWDSESVFGEGNYVGHDEPATLFYDSHPGAGNNSTYLLRLPKDPPRLPTQDGKGGTFNFQLHPTFWFGMALCDNESAPEFTHEQCTPDSDANIFDGSNPAAPDYIGKHPGTAFVEMQFYPPGWVPWPAGDVCDATRWCAAMNIFSLSQDMNTGAVNNTDCLNRAGIEPDNFAFVTKNGKTHAPPNPLDATLQTFTPNPNTDLFMNSGDSIAVSLRDTAAGLRVDLTDLTARTHGSMTASKDNGFAQVVFDPTATTCSVRPFAFRPMYSTSNEHTRVPWAAHSYNVSFSDEIGHFEYCDNVDANGGCASENNGQPADGDEAPCFTPDQSLRVKISGCLGTDNDFDGVSYQKTWPGSNSATHDAQFNPESVLFTSPRFGAGHPYERAGFEADLPRIEAADLGGPFPPCDRTTGTNCVNPPPGANFYPLFTTRGTGSACQWQLGGTQIPGTRQTFGGTSTTEFGPALNLTYPGPGNTPTHVINDFRNVLSHNPC
jgi:hypothetical protein